MALDLDGKHASVGHGVARIGGQVENHLLQLALIGIHHAQVFNLHMNLQLDFRAHHDLNHVGDLADHHAQIERMGRHHLTPAKSQQLLGQSGGLFGGGHDLVGPERLGGIGGGHLHQLGVAGDDAQNIVEIVGHAARQPAHGFHLLRLAQPFFQVLLLGDVVQNDEMPAGQDIGAETAVAEALDAVVATDPEARASAAGIAHLYPVAFLIAAEEFEQAASSEIFARQAHQAAGGGVGFHAKAFVLDDHDAVE